MPGSDNKLLQACLVLCTSSEEVVMTLMCGQERDVRGELLCKIGKVQIPDLNGSIQQEDFACV